MIVLHDPDTLLHETVELLGAKVRPALESPIRIQAIVQAIQKSHHDLRQPATPSDGDIRRLIDLVCLTHKPDYIEHLQTAHKEWVSAGLIESDESILPECFVFTNGARSVPQRPLDIYARAGYYAFDMSSGITNKTFQSTVASANLSLQAVEILTQPDENADTVLALCRPPGHHCDGQRAGGYCYINNAALAVSVWREHHADARIGILDIDFHHGNGTQEIFYDDPRVLYVSIHGEHEFPYYTGAAEEQGAGHGVGANINLPLKPGSSFQEYLEQLEKALDGLKKFGTCFLLVSLGFDTFHLDPLGSFQIETESYSVIAQTIRRSLAHIPAVILFEGGYVIEHLGSNMLAFLEGWECRSVLPRS